MNQFFNHHTHSRFCDGTGKPEDYILAAIDRKFHTLGFSSHAPVPFKNNFAIAGEAGLLEYCSTIRALQKKYEGRINVFLGLELDYISGISEDFRRIKERCGIDYTIGSVHLVRNGKSDGLWFIDGPKVESFDSGLKEIFGGDIRAAVTAYYKQVNEMVVTQKPDIIGHFDKVKMHNKGRYFNEDEPWYRELVNELISTFKSSGVIVEVNTRGIYKKRYDDLYPGKWILKILQENKIHITLSSDAHRPEEVDGYFEETIELLREIGYDSLVCFKDDTWAEMPIY
jgi:histidinol-phosphatase (PHP family)